MNPKQLPRDRRRLPGFKEVVSGITVSGVVMDKLKEALMTVCNQCGECCRYVAIRILDPSGAPVADDADFMDWVSVRMLKYTEDGWLVIPSECPHLDWDMELEKLCCTLHPNKPVYCKRYPIGDTWKPKSCNL